MVEAEAKSRSDSQVTTLFIEKGQAIYLVIEEEAKSRSDSQVTHSAYSKNQPCLSVTYLFQFLCWLDQPTNILMQVTQPTCPAFPLRSFSDIPSTSLPGLRLTCNMVSSGFYWHKQHTQHWAFALLVLPAVLFLQVLASLTASPSRLLRSFHVSDHLFNTAAPSTPTPNNTWSYCLFFPYQLSPQQPIQFSVYSTFVHC